MVDRKEEETAENYLIRLAIDEKIEKPERMFVKAELPFDDIDDLIFSSSLTNNQWQSVLEFKYLNQKGPFLCSICQVICRGISSVNTHFNGYTHKCKQLAIRALQYKKCSKVTKNCCIQIEDEFKLSINKNAAKHFKNILEKWQNSDKNGKDVEFNEISELPKEIAEKFKALNNLCQNILGRSDVFQKIKNNDEIQRRNRTKEAYLGHIGVEYVLKIVEDELDPKPSYECSLCEYLADEKRMQQHLLGYDHRKKYLELHYLSTIRKYEASIGHMKFTEYRLVMIEILKELAINIEAHHGRSLPYVVTSKEYDLHRADIINEIYTMQHASQTRGPSFSQIVSVDDIEDLKKEAKKGHNKDFRQVAVKEILFTISMDDKTYLNQGSNDPIITCRNRRKNPRRNESKRSHSPTDEHHSRSSDYRLRTQRRQRDKTRSRSPLPLYLKSGVGISDNYRGSISPTLWNEFYEKLSHATQSIERSYANYRKNPENHPQYEEEWNKFWQRRKLEIEEEGLNYRTYNFQPEWVQYFKRRIEHLCDHELQNARNNLYHKYNISTGVDITQYDDNRNNEDTSMEYNNIKEDSLMETNSTFISQREFGNASIVKQHGQSRQHRYNNEEHIYAMERQQTGAMNIDDSNKRIMTDMIPAHSTSSGTDTTKVSNITDNHSNLVHVLRLITALEDHLGSLGNKVMDLLGIALKLEKNFHGNIMEFESQILTAPNCNMLETAVEKLKGILFAGLVDNKKVSGFSRVIQVTTELLNYADERGWRQDINMSKSHSKSIVQLMPISSNERVATHYQLIHDNKHMQTEDNIKDFGYNPSSNQGKINESMSCAPPPPPQIKMMNTINSNLYDGGKDMLQVSANNNNQGFNQKSLMPLRFQIENTSSHLNFMENDYDINKSLTRTTTLRRSGNITSQSDAMVGGIVGDSYDNNNSNSCRYNTNNDVSRNNIGMMGISVGSDGGGGRVSQNHLYGGMHSNDILTCGSSSLGIGNNMNSTKHVTRNTNVAKDTNLILPMKQNRSKNSHHGEGGDEEDGEEGGVRIGGRKDQDLSEKHNSKLSWSSMLRNNRN